MTALNKAISYDNGHDRMSSRYLTQPGSKPINRNAPSEGYSDQSNLAAYERKLESLKSKFEYKKQTNEREGLRNDQGKVYNKFGFTTSIERDYSDNETTSQGNH